MAETDGMDGLIAAIALAGIGLGGWVWATGRVASWVAGRPAPAWL